MIVLGVETSCDETAVAIVKDGKEVIANVVYSQIDIFEKFGGVIPEVASRKHIQKITVVFDECLKMAMENKFRHASVNIAILMYYFKYCNGGNYDR